MYEEIEMMYDIVFWFRRCLIGRFWMEKSIFYYLLLCDFRYFIKFLWVLVFFLVKKRNFIVFL